MKVILFGATGMVGSGVLRECLLDRGVEQVLTVGRSATGVQLATRLKLGTEKLREIVHKNLMDISAIEGELRGYDACFFCLGVTSLGMTEAEYRKVSFGITMAVAETLARLNPEMTFIYVSGTGTDSTEQGRIMWARVKGTTENALLRLPFEGVYMFRPAVIQPLHGIRSKTSWYQVFYDVLGPLLTMGKRWLPKYVTTTEQVGKAMLAVARRDGGRGVLENADINSL